MVSDDRNYEGKTLSVLKRSARGIVGIATREDDIECLTEKVIGAVSEIPQYLAAAFADDDNWIMNGSADDELGVTTEVVLSACASVMGLLGELDPEESENLIVEILKEHVRAFEVSARILLTE